MTIKIKPGEYDESLTLDSNVTLVGDGDPADIKIIGKDSPAVTIENASATIRNLTLRSRGEAAVYIKKGGKLYLRHCRLSESQRYGLLIEEGGSVEMVDGCVVEKNRDAGMWIEEGTAILKGVKFRGNGSWGLRAEVKGRFEMTGCTFENNSSAAAFADRKVGEREWQREKKCEDCRVEGKPAQESQ